LIHEARASCWTEWSEDVGENTGCAICQSCGASSATDAVVVSLLTSSLKLEEAETEEEEEEEEEEDEEEEEEEEWHLQSVVECGPITLEPRSWGDVRLRCGQVAGGSY